jgi:uncharacterized protein (DUF1800 family)
MTLKPWSGAERWTEADAAHLLRRAGFGVGSREIGEIHRLGLDAAVNRLTTVQPESDEFNYSDRTLRAAAFASGGIDHLKAWWLHRMRRSANPLVEKMTLLWHNHFATSNAKVRSVPHMAVQNDLFRQYAFGGFRELLHAAAKDVAMLIWLDGEDNRKRAPNENFAREIMELFALGVGNYTERDIQQAAKAFTGWQVRNEQFWFDRRQHDPGPKTVFGKTGNFGGAEIVDLCLDQPACPRFVALKLLRGFVCDRPTPEAVAAVAENLTAHRMAVGKTLRDLLRSEIFYARENRAAIVKGPLDFALGLCRALDANPNYEQLAPLLARLGQDVFAPPTVKGWEGGRLWVSSATMLLRTQFVADFLGGAKYGETPKLAATLALQLSDAERTVRRLEALLLARPLEDAGRRQAVDYLRQAKGSDEERVRGVCHLLATAPEFQLM